VAAVVLVTPGTAGAINRGVTGTLTGSGGFTNASCTGATIDIGGTGTFTSTGIGSGTYTYHACITQVPGQSSTFSFVGKAKFVTDSGAKLKGKIAYTQVVQSGPTFKVKITGGTKRFALATGKLFLGPFTQSNESNCAHLICSNWDETGPVTGTVKNIIHS
jgi:hypothetical protein